MKYIGQHIFDYVASFRQNVGVGTDTPGEKLTVAGNIEISVASTGAKGLIFNENGTQTMGIKYQGGQSGNPIDIFRYQDNTTKVRFLENGNVGIGLTSPTEKLHVNGNAIITGGDSVAPQLKLLHDGTNPSTNEELGVVQFQVDYNGSHEDWGKIRLDTNASAFRTNMEFYVKSASGSEQVALTLQGQASAVPNAAFAGDVTIPGNLTVSGTTTTIDTTNLNVEDKNITINYSTGDSSSTADGAGITIQDAVDSSNDATFLWDATNDKFSFSHGVILSGNITIPNNGTIFCDGTGELRIGNTNSGTVKIGGDGTSTTLTPHSNNLIIRTIRDTDDIIFQAGASVSEFFRLDANTGFTRFADSKQLTFGAGDDLKIQHNGTNSEIGNFTGSFNIYTHTDDGDINFQADNGSGGIETYFLLDGSEGVVTFPDDKRLTFGTGRDLFLYHTGTDMVMKNFTGDMVIKNEADDKDIIFQSDDGSGGVTDYIRLDGSETRTVIAKAMRFNDNTSLQIGGGADLSIHHDGGNTLVQNITGHLYFYQKADDSDISFFCDDGSGGNTEYFRIDGGTEKVVYSKPIEILDNNYLFFGNSQDLGIHHNGTDTTIKNNTGDFYIKQDAADKNIIFQGDDASGGLTTYFQLYGNHSGNPITQFPDNSQIHFGDGFDFRITHDGSQSILNNQTGNLEIVQNADDADIIFKCDDALGGTTEYFRLDGGDSMTRFTRQARFSDSVKLKFGSGGDTAIYHDSGDSYIDHTGTGNLYVRQGTDDAHIIFQCDDGSGGLTDYVKIDGNNQFIRFDKNTYHPTGKRITIGSGQEGRIFYESSTLKITQTEDDADISFQCDDGTGGVTEYFRLDGGLAGGDGSGTYFTVFPDNSRIGLGNNADLRMFHNGSASYIQNILGDLYIQNSADDSDIIFRTDDGSGSVTSYLTMDGSTTSMLAGVATHFSNTSAAYATGTSNSGVVDGLTGAISTLGGISVKRQSFFGGSVFVKGMTQTSRAIEVRPSTTGNGSTFFPLMIGRNNDNGNANYLLVGGDEWAFGLYDGNQSGGTPVDQSHMIRFKAGTASNSQPRVFVGDSGSNTTNSYIEVAGHKVGTTKAVVLLHGSDGVVGNSGSNSSDSHTWTITHGMGSSRNYKVEIIQNSGNYDTVHADITRPSDTTIVVTFSAAVANSAYKALILKCG